MWKLLTMLTLSGMVYATLLAPVVVQAQRAESEQMFNRRMDSRLDRVIMDCRRIRRDFEPTDEDGKRQRSRYDPDSGLLKQLETIEKAAREQRRELDMSTGPTPRTDYDLYMYQQQVQYNVRNLEEHVHYIRDMVRDMEAREEKQNAPVEEQSPDERDEDGVSDEDWAEEWARGDR